MTFTTARRTSTSTASTIFSDNETGSLESFAAKKCGENALSNEKEVKVEEKKKDMLQRKTDALKRITGELRLQSILTSYSSDITTRYFNVPDKYAIFETYEQDDHDKAATASDNVSNLLMTGIAQSSGAPSAKNPHGRKGEKSTRGRHVSSTPLLSIDFECAQNRRHTRGSSSSSCSSKSTFSSLIGTSMDITSKSQQSQSSNSKYSYDEDSSFYYSATSTDSSIVPAKTCRHCRKDCRPTKTMNEKTRHREENNVQDDIFSKGACKFNRCAENFIDLQWVVGDEYRAIFHNSISISHDSANHELFLASTQRRQQKIYETKNDPPLTCDALPVHEQEDAATVAAPLPTISSCKPKEYLALDLQHSLKKDDDSKGIDNSSYISEIEISSRLVQSSISEDDSNISNSEDYLEEHQKEELGVDERLFQSLPTPRSSIKILREARNKATMVQEELLRSQEEIGCGLSMFMPTFIRPFFSFLERHFYDSFCNQQNTKQKISDGPSPSDKNQIINYLYSAIRCHNSLQAMAHLDQNLEEAKVWVTCYDTLSPDGNLMPVQVLPLHTACLSKSPIVLVKKILEAYPDAVRKRAGNTKYPIHLACESGADPAVISLLLESWPESLYACDGQGNIPLTNLVRSSPFCHNKVEAMKLFLSAFEKQPTTL